MEQFLSLGFLVGLAAGAIRLATPLLLSALGEIVSERAGVLNIGLEGMMLTGAFAGFGATYLTGTPWIGVAAAVLAGALVALVHAWVSIDLRGDQVVSGIALNLVALGLTSYLNRVLFGSRIIPVHVNTLDVLPVPVLSEIPVLGPVLFQHSALVYLGLLLVPALWFVLRKTTWGLMIRASGEHPLAAESMGVRVRRVRYLGTLAAGGLAGLGGAFLSLAQFDMFSNGMTVGRGFIALAVVIFGKWDPFGALAAALLFGLASAFQLRVQALGVEIPYQFLLMLPYVLTILALLGVVGRTRAPAALAQPYAKEEAS